MKMVKSLLLGSAAGILAVAGAQAADLPVKAKPVEYVKVCSLYGAGFFYIPGTDTCLKVGGFVRVDVGFNAGGSHGQFWQGANAVENRNSDEFVTRTRFNYTFDARTQTEYGTLRSYIRAGLQYTTDNGNNGDIYFDRGFIQLGGFTFGKTVSFFDMFSGGGVSITSLFGGSDTGNGVNALAYTAQFGNGFSGTISFEDATYRRAPGIYQPNALLANIGAGANFAGYGGTVAPDIVGNLRVDQAWGSAQLMAALHQVRGTYYGATEGTGAPEDVWGFAIGGGLKINLPWAAGDAIYMHATYAEGAGHYNNLSNGGGQAYGIYNGTTAFEGYLVDGVYSNVVGSDIQLTKTWGINAGIEHYWTPMLRTSLFGAYTAVEFDAAAATYICATSGYNAAFGAGCNPDWNVWQLGSKTTWNPVKNLDVSLEVLYTKFEQEHAAGVTRTNATAFNGKPAIAYTMEDQDVFSGFIRIQRNFWP